MILFTLLLLTVAIVATIALTIAGVIGSAAVVIFGDVFVCVLLIALIIKIFKKKK